MDQRHMGQRWMVDVLSSKRSSAEAKYQVLSYRTVPNTTIALT